ncbi:MAG TPA: septum formation initiator family protein [Opitutaceae bacterium]|nr:septum formation initiator family protein [Opitutaceae bacterium]
MNVRRLIIALYVVLLAGISLAAGAVFLDARAQYRQLRQAELANRQRLAAAKARLQEQQVTLQRLKNDPEFVERAIRQRLKYAKPGEYIFRFPD